MTSTETIDKAERILADLQDQREEMCARISKLATDRKKYSFAAYTAQNAQAKERLRKSTEDSIEAEHNIESLDVAISEAQSRLEATKREAALTVDRQQAEQLRQLVNELGDLGTEIDAAFGDAIAHLANLKAVLNKIHALGCQNPSHDQLRVISTLAVKTVLMQLPYPREFEHLAPSSRTSFGHAIARWQAMLLENITARLSEAKTTEAA
jgi:chromosome segregation ATPase